MKLTTTKLIAIGSLAVISILITIVGNVITGLTGVPGMGGILNGFLGPIFFIVCALLIKRFGAATLMGFVVGVLTLPLPAFGTAGFLPKILTTMLIGLSIDIIFAISRAINKKPGVATSMLGAALLGILTILLILGLGKAFNMPGVEKFAQLLTSIPILSVMVVSSALGGLVGYVIFAKVENTAVVKRIQGEQPV